MIKYIKRIHWLPYSLWCGAVFFLMTGICFIVIYLLFALKPKNYSLWAHRLPTYTAKTIGYLWLIKVNIEGEDIFDHNQQYIFVGNHRSMLDAIISGGFIPNPKKFIGKADFVKWPFIGYILKNMYIPVDRSSKESRQRSKEQLFVKMKEGFSMVIFSEGKTNATEEVLLPFKDGAFEASAICQVPIVPFVINGADKLWHRSVWLLRPGVVKLKYLSIQSIPENNSHDVQALKEKVFNEMKDSYLKEI